MRSETHFGSEGDLNEVRSAIQLLLQWAYKHNKNFEEQAAQLHTLTSKLLWLLDASLNAYLSPDCSLKIALNLTRAIKDATQGSESGKDNGPGGLVVLDALICIDHEKFLLSQVSNFKVEAFLGLVS